MAISVAEVATGAPRDATATGAAIIPAAPDAPPVTGATSMPAIPKAIAPHTIQNTTLPVALIRMTLFLRSPSISIVSTSFFKASPNSFSVRTLVSSISTLVLSRAILLPRPDTLGAEKKSGVPYFHTPYGRCRQTPVLKHDQKTRHVGLAHVAQPSYLAITLWNFGEVFRKATIRSCVRAGGLSGLPSSSGWCGGHGATVLPLDPEVLPYFLGRRRFHRNHPPVFGHAGCVTKVSGRWRTLGAVRRYAFHSLFFLVPFICRLRFENYNLHGMTDIGLKMVNVG